MINARDLLGQLMQAGLSGSTNDRIAHGMGPNGLGQSGNPLGDLLGGLLGKGGGSVGGSGGGGLSDFLGQGKGGLPGGLGDLASQAESMLRGPGGKDALAMGGLASLAGAVLGGRRGGTGGAIGGGLLALLGSLAFSALKQRDAQSASASQADLAREAPLGLREPQTPAEEQELQNTAHLAISAMINAAKADGAIDGSEMGRIMGKLNEAGADPEAKDFVMNEFQKPLDLDGLVCSVKSPEVAVQVYSASLLAIEVDTSAEKDYLLKLAQKLGLDAETVQRVHDALGVAPVGQPASV